MVGSYRDKRTRDFAMSRRVKEFNAIESTASKKLEQLDAATTLADLTRPGNSLESLKGDRKGQYSIRINDKWRICFEWSVGMSGPENVEIVDYH
jgi:proteic killer suppression protein